jgi:hypothetical protein
LKETWEADERNAMLQAEKAAFATNVEASVSAGDGTDGEV